MYLECLGFVSHASASFLHTSSIAGQVVFLVTSDLQHFVEFRVHWCQIYLRVDRSRCHLSELKEFTRGTRLQHKGVAPLFAVYIGVYHFFTQRVRNPL